MFNSPNKIKDRVERDHVQNPPNTINSFQTTNNLAYKVHSVSPPKRRYESPIKSGPFIASTTYRHMYNDYKGQHVDYFKEP